MEQSSRRHTEYTPSSAAFSPRASPSSSTPSSSSRFSLTRRLSFRRPVSMQPQSSRTTTTTAAGAAAEEEKDGEEGAALPPRQSPQPQRTAATLAVAGGSFTATALPPLVIPATSSSLVNKLASLAKMTNNTAPGGAAEDDGGGEEEPSRSRPPSASLAPAARTLPRRLSSVNLAAQLFSSVSLSSGSSSSSSSSSAPSSSSSASFISPQQASACSAVVAASLPVPAQRLAQLIPAHRKQLIHALVKQHGDLAIKIRFIDAVDQYLTAESTADPQHVKMGRTICQLFVLGDMFKILTFSPDTQFLLERERVDAFPQARGEMLRELAGNPAVLAAMQEVE